jgi:hypothetical protein
MAILPHYEACQRCGEDLEGVHCALGVCGWCARETPRPTRVERATYGWERRTQDRHHQESWTWLKRLPQRP